MSKKKTVAKDKRTADKARSLVERGDAKAAKGLQRRTVTSQQSMLFDKQLADAAHKSISLTAVELNEANIQFSEWSREVVRLKNKLSEILQKHKVTKKYRVGDLVAVLGVTPQKFDAKVEEYKE